MMAGKASSERFADLAILGGLAVFLFLAAALLGAVAPDWRWEHHPVHALAEGLGAFAALTVATLIWILRRLEALPQRYSWILAGLLSMGTLDGFHAATHAGNLFVWYHTLAGFAGGLLFAGIVIPSRLSTRVVPYLPTFTLYGSVGVALVMVMFSDSLPAMTRDGAFTDVARILNIVGGVGFLIAAALLAWNPWREHDPHRRLFASHALLFGVSGIIFEQSTLWDGVWWLWHGCRLLAYGCALSFLFHQLYQALWDSVASRQGLEEAVSRKTEELAAEVASHSKREAAYRALAEDLEERAKELERAQLATLNIAEDANEERRRADHAGEILREVNAELDQFAYVASHDLKAPLRAIENLALWIQQDAEEVLPEDSKRHLTTLRQRIQRMRALLNDLLAYSRAGRAKGAFGKINSGEVVRDVVALIGPPDSIEIRIGEDFPVIESFPVPFELVLRNLISNAVKHMGQDEGCVEISAVEDGPQIAFTVADTGPGIPEDCRERVFEMFQTLAPRDEVEGTGMGLAIVRKVVESEGGRVTVADNGDRGARFTFWWPKVSIREKQHAS